MLDKKCFWNTYVKIKVSAGDLYEEKIDAIYDRG